MGTPKWQEELLFFLPLLWGAIIQIAFYKMAASAPCAYSTAGGWGEGS